MTFLTFDMYFYRIRHFHMDHNAPYLPRAKVLHNQCLGCLLRRLQYPGIIGNNGYAKFWG